MNISSHAIAIRQALSDFNMERRLNGGDEATGLDKEQVKYCIKVMGAFAHCTPEVTTLW